MQKVLATDSESKEKYIRSNQKLNLKNFILQFTVLIHVIFNEARKSAD